MGIGERTFTVEHDGWVLSAGKTNQVFLRRREKSRRPRQKGERGKLAVLSISRIPPLGRKNHQEGKLGGKPQLPKGGGTLEKKLDRDSARGRKKDLTEEVARGGGNERGGSRPCFTNFVSRKNDLLTDKNRHRYCRKGLLSLDRTCAKKRAGQFINMERLP